jgi:hypothetical protein
MRPIRHSLFDLVRQREQSLKDAKLVVRAHRENGVSIGEKIADDIYIMFQFLEGANNMSEDRSTHHFLYVLARPVLRLSMIVPSDVQDRKVSV